MNLDGEPDAEDLEFYRRYGPWEPVDPVGAEQLMAGYREPWWIVGGYAIEAFTRTARRHEDCDVVIFARHLDIFRAHFESRFHLWAVGSGALRPLDDRFPELPDWAGQVWLREHALAPWRLDCIVNPDQDGRWQSKRDEAHVADLDQITWVDDRGIRYLNPEVTLLFKAKQAREKDRLDLEAAWPRLAPQQRTWLRDAVQRMYPEHPWNERLARA
jgi:hypothetical protein